MCGNELKELVLVGDVYTRYGIEKGYYPADLTRRLSVVDFDDKSALANVPFHGQCRPALNCLYACDVYSGSYVMIMNERQEEVDNSDIFARSKAAAIRGALLKMGAKHIEVTNSLDTFRSSDTGGGVGGGNLIARANVNARYSDDASTKYKSCLEQNVPNNTPSSEDEVKKYMNEHFLWGSELDLENMLSLTPEQRVGSSYSLTVDLIKEMNSALDIAVGLDIKLFGFKANFKRTTKSQTHLSMSIRVQF
ncbi:MAG: hypothetical protein ACI35N_06795 [Marinilabiliaceae bacterium]